MKKGSKLPKKDVVLFVIKEIMQRHSEINSQKEFADLVSINLKKVDSKLSISGKRARLACLSMPNMKIIVETKKGRIKKRCPSCSQSLKRIYTKNLKGRKVLYKLSCSRCGYSGKSGKWVPKRYRFVKK